MWIAQKVFSKFYDVVFSSKCFICRKNGEELCDVCLTKLPRCVETPYSFIYSHFSFQNETVRRIIRTIKYYNRKSLIPPLSKKIISGDLEAFLGYKNYILLPIPMPKLREWLRGGNHSQFLANHLAEILNFEVNDKILIRKNSNSQQAKAKNISQRKINMKGAFKVNPIIPFDSNIILIDDITTTGATLLEAKTTLEKAGYKNIKAITLAH